MFSDDTNITKPQDETGVKSAGEGLCLYQQSATAQFNGSPLDELKDVLVARGERKIEETSDRLIAQLHEGKLLSEEAISRISGEVAEKVVSKIFPADVEPQRDFVSSVKRLVRTPSKALGF
ncbi:MAG: hypothetical protein PHW63_00075 [Alphaproteobacteria bacterium]|nr:hypothetical protein [Alphaproteobacteria bacterium]